MNKINSQKTDAIRAALVTMPPDEPAQIVKLALMIHHQTNFRLTILGYHQKSFLDLPPSGPFVGIPVVGPPVGLPVKSSQGAVQMLCKEIWKSLEHMTVEDSRLEVDYISGRQGTIVKILKSTFDLIIFPYAFEVPSLKQYAFSDIDTELIKTEHIPVLFCAEPIKWQRIIMLEANGEKRFGDIAVMNYLKKFLGETILEEAPKNMPTIGLHSDELTGEKSELESFGFVDASKMSLKDQADTVLVVPSKVACSVLRYRKLKSILKNWSGNVLVLPY